MGCSIQSQLGPTAGRIGGERLEQRRQITDANKEMELKRRAEEKAARRFILFGDDGIGAGFFGGIGARWRV